MEIVKRSGEVVLFDSGKILNAIQKALTSSQESTDVLTHSQNVCQDVLSSLENKTYTVEEIQDKVETSLMDNHLYKTAKCYILYRDEHNKNRLPPISEKISRVFAESSEYFENDTMRECVFLRTYSRWLKNENRRESWVETVKRYMDFMKENLGDKLNLDEYNEIQTAIKKQEVMPSMRLLQFSGEAARRCNATVYNCSYTAPECFKDLADITYLLMSGCGVGFSVESVHVEKFPVIHTQKSPSVIHEYVIEDSKEAWCDAFLFGLQTWYVGEDVKFDYSKLRPSGAPLKIMGGRSSGPQPLIDLMEFTRTTILNSVGMKLTNLQMYDIICKIGQIVVSGGIRRSAMISLSDLHDSEIRDAKSGMFWNTNPQRSMANNSAAYNVKPNMTQFMKEWLSLAESGTGERGIFNRAGLEKILPKRRVDKIGGEILSKLGCNPCGEILLQPNGFCNLTEVVCRSDDTLESLLRKARIATILGTYQSTLTNFKYISPKWKINQEMERLLGVSLTGQYDCQTIRNVETLKQMKKCCLNTNIEFSKRFGINPSTAITTTKPSGTVSQLVNSSSGIHPRFSKYYIRRIRISATDPLFKLMKDQGFNYNPEVGQQEDTATTFVLDFPVKSPEDAICVDDVSALEQLEYWKIVKMNYVEHNSSVTIYVKPDEWFKIGQWLWDNWEICSGLSFLPYSDHVYKLAPYSKINKEEYEELVSKMKNVDFSKLIHYEKIDNTDVKKEVACAGGVCEL